MLLLNMQLNQRQTRGKDEMQALASAVFDAVEAGELDELFETLHARVFDRSPEDLFDVDVDDGVTQWRFKPMVELLLRHIAETAADRSRQAAERHDEIVWAVEAVGF